MNTKLAFTMSKQYIGGSYVLVVIILVRTIICKNHLSIFTFIQDTIHSPIKNVWSASLLN